MLLRICLILAILAGVGSILVSQLQVKPYVQTIIDARNDFEGKWKTETSRANNLKKDLTASQNKLASTEGELDTTKSNLRQMSQEKDVQEKRAQVAELEASKLKQVLAETRQKIALYEILGRTPEELKALMESERKLQAALEALKEENSVLLRDRNKWRRMYEDLIKGSDEVTIDLLPGIKGKVLVVDPKWNFVVVDVGEKKQGAVNGVLLISRNGRLVGKVKIVSITADRSIANVLPGWKLDELMEGDDVLN